MALFGKKRQSKQQQRVLQIIDDRPSYATALAWFDALLDALGSDRKLEADALQTLELRFHESTGAWNIELQDEHEAHVHLWTGLVNKFPEQPRLQALAADTLFHHQGDPDTALAMFLAAVRKEPALFSEFSGEMYDVAKEAGAKSWLRFRLAQLLNYADTAQTPDDWEALRELARDVFDEFSS